MSFGTKLRAYSEGKREKELDIIYFFIYEEDLKIIVAYMHVCIFPKTVESLTSFT